MQQTKENKMGVMPVGRLLVGVSLPIVVSMLVQAMYNIVDGIFVAQWMEEAFAAVSLAFPVQNLMIAVSVGTGVGVNSLLSRRLGEKDFKAANRAALNGLFVTLLSWIVFVIFGLFFARLYFVSASKLPQLELEIAAAMAQNNQGILQELNILMEERLLLVEMGTSYLRIVTIGSFGLFMGITGERLLQATGLSVFSMVSQMVGALTNIILDPIMIFGLFGFPEMGIEGAAIATVIGQIFGMIVAMVLNRIKNKEITLELKGFRPHLPTIKNIYTVGLPSIVMQSIGSVMTYGMNAILMAFGTIPVKVLGIYFNLQSFVFMPVFGFNNGMVPIIAYNYGARNRQRIEKTIKIGVAICVVVMILGTLMFWLIPEPMMSLFKASDEMVQMGKEALKIISLGFPLAGVCIVVSGVFQAIGKGGYSLIMSVVRQLVLLLPAAWILAKVSGMPALWAAFPISEFFSLILAVFFFKKVYKKYIRPLGAEQTKVAPALDTE